MMLVEIFMSGMIFQYYYGVGIKKFPWNPNSILKQGVGNTTKSLPGF